MRRVRNFWIEVRIDGRKTPLRGGPMSKDGGFTLSILGKGPHATIPLAGMVGTCENGAIVLKVDLLPMSRKKEHYHIEVS